MLPPLIAERTRLFRRYRAQHGLNTRNLKTKAVRDGKNYLVSGQKVWISTAQVAEKVLLLARAEAGLTLFYTELDRRHVEVREIEKMGATPVDSTRFSSTRAAGSGADRIGEEARASNTSCTA